MHTDQKSNFDFDVIIYKNAHSLEFIISMFPCIQNLSIK